MRPSSLFSPELPWRDRTPWGDRMNSSLAEPSTADMAGAAIAKGRFFHEGMDHYA